MNTWTELDEYQPITTKILQNSLSKNRVSHAYLFHGPRGTGKKDAATLLAKSYFCRERKDDVNPCNTCLDCKRIDSGNHPDLHFITPDGQSIKKEQIAHLQKEFHYTGLESNQKMYIVEHADTMTPNAANQILKFLEEPSQRTIALLLTENIHGIIHTIRSRCQILTFQPLNFLKFKEQLENKEIPPSLAGLYAHLTNNLQEALQLNEDEWFAEARKIVIKLMEVLYEQPDEAYLLLHSKWLPHFKEKGQAQVGLDLLLIWYKDLIYYHIDREEAIVNIGNLRFIEKLSYIMSQTVTTYAIKAILEAKRNLQANVNSTLVMEKLVLQLQR
ncbi:DNA polymerase III subunit delta' [Salirhabdus salicampi]|uniref:DNA polymerase III subunit delta' n=1 Tax=Salirhabdus salicampi TaxID=476102 RepID=UPI0020C3A05D|nr:DNA polymerase III subunit delta' [Salirhabdus salicampi]MCP8618154.1 DNA polymerase III subunit delta' [Salirhabdus salicampi]